MKTTTWSNALKKRLQANGFTLSDLKKFSDADDDLIERIMSGNLSYIERIGVSQVISTEIRRLKNRAVVTQDELLDHRRKTWTGKTAREINLSEGCALMGIYSYARRNKIEIVTTAKRKIP
jgi:hypothetical protein